MRLLLALLLASCTVYPTAPAQERDAYSDALSAVRVIAPQLPAHIKVDTTRTEYALTFNRGGYRVIFANHRWLALVALNYGHGAAVGVYAHELAHHPVVMAPLAPESPAVEEMLADAVAGCALAVLGVQPHGYAQLLKDETTEGRAAAAHDGHRGCDRRMPR